MRKARPSLSRPQVRAVAERRWSQHDGIRVGISGWTYPPWRGVFYPEKLPRRGELEFASRTFNSIEINGSFYSLQRPSSYQRWYSETPPGFVFSVKGARFITHMKKLREVERLSQISSPPVFFVCAKSWDRSSGNSRRTLAGRKIGSATSSSCCHAIPPRRQSWPVDTTTS